MEKLLFVDACIRGEQSRTKKLCDVYLEEFRKHHPDVEMETVTLERGVVEPHTVEYIRQRDSYVAKKDWNHPMFDLAKQFKAADYIVIGSPYWDLSFAAILKVYIEVLMVADLTFESTETGLRGLCGGKLLTYITTAGGFIGDKNYGYDYMQGVADMFGIAKTQCFKAEGLDIEGFDVDGILAEAAEEIRNSF